MKTIYFMLPELSAGGAERVSITIARLLKKQGLDVRFLNLGHPEGEMKEWIEPEFELTSLGCNRVLSAFGKLYDFLKDKPNAVLFSSREHLSVVGILTAKRLNIPMIVRIPNMPTNRLERSIKGRIKELTIKKINKRILPYAKTIIAQNEEMADKLKHFYGLTDDKIIAINNPVDKEYILSSTKDCTNPFNSECINFLNVCNITYAKGIDILLKAFEKVTQHIPNAHLTIVGRDASEYAKTIKEQAKSNNRVTFAGFQGNPYPYLKYCDVFVLPSRMEGFPNVVLEAMCFDKPIASTTCVDVIKKIVENGVNGYYCDIEDINALAECMIKATQLNNIENNYNLFDLSKLLNVFK